ncbi:MAG: cytochrome P450 [Denitromonas halophila]|nr:MAG: cytochrome P450 [Denitromonas halophila]TVT75713.1 MAG: cytochrome P450 [Denitromonas halophila]
MSTPIIPTELVAPIWNPASYANRDAVEQIFATLRRDYPLAMCEVPGYKPHWIVTKYKDVREVSRLDDIFHSGDISKTPASIMAEAMMAEYSGGKPHIFRTLVHMDKPDHTEYRNVVKDVFMPQNVATLKDGVLASAREFADQMADMNGECDFAETIAMRYPLQVICDQIGLPREDHATMLRLTQWFLSYADPDLCRPGSVLTDPEQQIKTWQIVYDEFKSYYTDLVAQRRAEPRKDLATLIAHGQIHGQPMDERGMISYFVIASTAGHDTTAATIGNAMWILARDPGLFSRIKADRSLISGFVEEAIRISTPPMAFVRSATQDYELSGQQIKKGDRLYVSYLSANKDEEVFDAPFAFQPDRTPNRHIGFGFGSHICVGQHLARLEMRTLWEELFERLEWVEMAGEGQWQESEFVCGPKRVPIRYKMN